MKTLLLTIVFCLAALPCFAFTPAQNEAMFNLVNAEPTMATAIAANDDQAVADWLNGANGSKGWKSYMPLAEMLGALNFTTFIGRSVAERDALNLMFSVGGVNCGQANIKQGFADIFSGTATAAVNQRAAMSAACQRDISRAEKALTGGLSGAAHLLNWEGTLSSGDASRILRGPW